VPLGLTDDECDELVRLLRATAASDRFPLSPRIRRLKAVLAQLKTIPALTGEPLPRRSPQLGQALCWRRSVGDRWAREEIAELAEIGHGCPLFLPKAALEARQRLRLIVPHSSR
jgi:hypothetical protein